MPCMGEFNTKTIADLMAHVDWEATEQDQGKFGGEMMVVLWFREGRSAHGTVDGKGKTAEGGSRRSALRGQPKLIPSESTRWRHWAL